MACLKVPTGCPAAGISIFIFGGEGVDQVVLDGGIVQVVVDNEDTETTALGFVVSVERESR